MGIGIFRKFNKAVRVAAAAAVILLSTSGTWAGTAAAHNESNPSANLDQWGNVTNAWVNGDLNSSKATYREGDAVPYRLTFGNLATTGSHTVTIQWDTTKGGKHALDYLTSYDKTVSPNPCSGVSGCGSPSTFAIPSDPHVTGAGVTQFPGNLTLYNGTITGVSGYTLSGAYSGDSSTQITITFTAATATPVLAWGGHIGSQVDWGFGNSASAISGSPYHTYLNALDGSGGQQDRALMASAILPTPTITTQVSSSAIYLGQSVTDLATLSGSNGTVGGTINFFLCGPSASAPNCTTGGTQVGATKTLSSGHVTSDSTGAITTAGTYCFRAEYTPSSIALYSPQNHTNLTTECFSVTQATGSLKVIKMVSNTHGGTLTASNFTLHVKSGGGDAVTPFNGSASGTTFSSLNAGTYTVSENDPTSMGYAQTSIICDGVTTSTVTITANSSDTCTITNTDIAPTLTLIKTVHNNHGGTADADDFGISINGHSVTSGAANQETANTPLTLNEAGLSGYSFVSLTGTGCPSTLGGTITLTPGQNATCTITNTDVAPSLTVIKHVVNGTTGSTSTASNFTLNVSGTNVSNPSFSGSESGTTLTLNAGSYDVTEGTHTGYTVSYSADCDTTIAIGGSKTCTVTNTAIAPTLTIAKTLDYHSGGTAGIGDFIYTITNSQGQTETVLAGVPTTLPIGSYTVSEGLLPGYSQESMGGNCTSNGSVTLALADAKTCTITNTDVAPTLTLVKDVSNTHGGTAGADDFGISINGHTVTSGVANQEMANTPLTINEAGLTGYQFVSLTGTGCPDILGGTITLTPGQDATCTITNTDVAPTLKVVKHVDNGSTGSTASASDFTLDVSGTNVSTPNFSGSESGTTLTLNAGSYDVTEPSHPGYTVSYSSDCDTTIAIGGSKTCTVTNTAIAPTLTITKTLDYNYGGTAGISDFIYTITDSQNQTETVLAGVPTTLPIGSYTVSEGLIPGYTQESLGGDCTSAGAVTLALADTKTCTITNTDVAPTLTVTKFHDFNDNGTQDTNEPGLAGWTITLTPDSGTPLTGVTVADGTVSFSNLTSGHYTLAEVNQTGWYQSAISCGDEEQGGSINLNVGDQLSCTIGNYQASIHIVKTANRTIGFQGDTIGYTFTVTNTGDVPLSDVALADALSGLSAISSPTGDTNHDGLLDTSETWVYTANYVIPSDQDVTNTVTVTGQEPGGNNVTDTSNVTVDVGSVLGDFTTTPGQVLGAATTLPDAGASDNTLSEILFSALAAMGVFLFSFMYNRRRYS